MQCICGFDSAADATFCGNCGAALGDGGDNAIPNALRPLTPVLVQATPLKHNVRPLSRVGIALVAAVVAVTAAGYWWMLRPPGSYKWDNSGLYPINANGKYGFMDRSGKTVIAPQFDLSIFGFSEGLAPVKIGTKWGYINTKGALTITPQFDQGFSFRNGRAAVALGSRYGLIDKDGKYIRSPTFLWVGVSAGDFTPVKTGDGVLAFVNPSGEVVLSGRFDSVEHSGFQEGLAAVSSGGKWGFIDTTGKWVIDPQFEKPSYFSEGLAHVHAGGRVGYIDRGGKFVINPQYDDGRQFSDGYASINSNGGWSFIDTQCRVLGNQKFRAVGYFRDGLAPVQTEAGWGYIDKTGKMVVSALFETAQSFQNGLARVTALGNEAYITTTGSFVVDPFPGRAGVPSHPVQELWTGTPPDGLLTYVQRFILIRDGTQIRGYSYYYLGRANHAIELKGQIAQDGSFNMTDQNGTSWKGQFVSSLLINGVQINSRSDSIRESPMRLRLVRDATAREVEALPTTSSDWGVFLAIFKEAVQRRDTVALSKMMARSFTSSGDGFLAPNEVLPRVQWDKLDGALTRGVEKSEHTPWGRVFRSILDEHPGPNSRFQVMLNFSQEGDNQWRWLGMAYPGD